jgi:imidazolonepropionase
MQTIFTHIQSLFGIQNDFLPAIKGHDLDTVKQLEQAWMLIEDDRIVDFGSMENFPSGNYDQEINVAGKLIIPTWCDSHTHLVFPKTREEEFVDRINGLTYEQIAANGGGILNSAKNLTTISSAQLFEDACQRLEELIRLGTGAIEIKSGYGLSLEAELKILRVIKQLKVTYALPIKATFLGAHAYPLAYKENKEGYIQLIIKEMLPAIAAEGLADYMDVFCEKGFFSVADTDRLLNAAAKYHLKPKIHANQLYNSGGVQIGVQHHAISVDHLECVGDEEISCLQNSATIPTLLPAAAFFLGISYQPARKMIDANLPVCLASDYNPGSCPSGNIPFLLSLACTQLKMTPNEAFNAVTYNGAAAMELQHEVGSITRGKKANFIISKTLPSFNLIPYSFGSNLMDKVYINGKQF